MAYVTKEFTSWDEFVSFAEQPPRWRADASSRMENRERTRFTGTETFDDAVRLARYGWPEGREQLTAAVAIARPKRAMVASMMRDVAGDYPLIPAAVAGDPMNMMVRRRSQVAACPVVRIDYDNSVQGDVSAQYIVNRGAALLSIVDALETQGYSCELRIINKTAGTFKGHKDKADFAIIYKRAGEPLDIDRAAFALCHPSTLRRLMFSVKEQFPEIQGGYGSYGHTTGEPWDGDGVYISSATDDDYSPEMARERMETLFTDYLEQ